LTPAGASESIAESNCQSVCGDDNHTQESQTSSFVGAEGGKDRRKVDSAQKVRSLN
jgi:hypothetical protein